MLTDYFASALWFLRNAYATGSEGNDRLFHSLEWAQLEASKRKFRVIRSRRALQRGSGSPGRIVEIGTSYGVSTLYLAAAVRDNIYATGGHGVVIGTEYEPEKARAAHANFKAAGLNGFIELREGDFGETLKNLDGPVDFMLIDIWIPMARPALELVAPHLRPGAIVLCDNTEQYRDAFADYFAFLNDPANGFLTMTLPFDGGLEFSVHC